MTKESYSPVNSKLIQLCKLVWLCLSETRAKLEATKKNIVLTEYQTDDCPCDELCIA